MSKQLTHLSKHKNGWNSVRFTSSELKLDAVVAENHPQHIDEHQL